MATIQENITRIMGGKDSIRNSIINKGLEVPEGLRVDTYSDFILHIGEEYSMDVTDVSSTSVWDEINRIKIAEDSIKSAIREKGVDVPEGLRIDDLSVYVDEIEVDAGPLTFETISGNGYLSLSKTASSSTNVNFEYSLDGEEWIPYTLKDQIQLTQGSKIQFRGDKTWSYKNGLYKFAMTSSDSSLQCKIYGDLMSMCNYSNSLGTGQFRNFFNGCSYLVDASGLVLSATELGEFCYVSMFTDCKNMVYGPKKLPATTMKKSCYAYMFERCVSLIESMESLPTIVLENDCYNSMFTGCTSLTNAPKLYCEQIAPTSLGGMFSKCSSLDKIYFNSEISQLNASNSSNWVGGVSSTGTFYRNPNDSSGVRQSVDVVPFGWTVQYWIQ